MQRSVAFLGGGIDGGAAVQQLADHVHVAVLGRQVDGIEAVL